MQTVKIWHYFRETDETRLAATVVLDGAGWTSEGDLAPWCDHVLKAVTDTRDPERARELALHTEFHGITLYAETEPAREPWEVALDALLKKDDPS